MGIRGLITFAESNQKCDFFESITLSNTNIVIDGNNLRFYLYNRLKGRNCAFGGEYKLYYDTVTKYFQRYVSVEFFGQFTLYSQVAWSFSLSIIELESVFVFQLASTRH